MGKIVFGFKKKEKHKDIIIDGAFAKTEIFCLEASLNSSLALFMPNR